MYEAFFGLSEKPFSIAPDPQYLYMSARHKEAMAHLRYGLSLGGGFNVLTGEVGTGKTTLCRNLISDLPEKVDIALILNASISELELLQSICDELDIEYEERSSQKKLLDQINRYLLESFAEGRRTVLIVDEAQLLSRKVLERIRILTNLETTKHKLLHIILIGQPELNDLLLRDDLRQVAQRVTARYHLGALKADEMGDYLNFRLSIAGCKRPLFSRPAIRKLHQLTAGIPRRINVLADHALLAAFAGEKSTIDSSTIRKAAHDVFLDQGKRGLAFFARLHEYRVWLLMLLLLAYFAGMLWWLQQPVETQPATASRPALLGEQSDVVQDQISPPASGAASAIEFVENEPANHGSAADDGESAVALEGSSGEVNQMDSTPTRIKRESLDVPIAETEGVHSNNSRDSSGSGVPRTSDGIVVAQGLTEEAVALQNLVGVWQQDILVVPELFCDQAAARGLACLSVPSWRQLYLFNRPAVLRLQQDGEVIFALLRRVENGVAEVQMGNQVFEVEPHELSEMWAGEGLALWQPPLFGSHLLRVGDEDAAVTPLRSRLNQAAQISGIPPLSNLQSEKFDQEMAQKVFELQLHYSISSDSMIGNETYLLINELTSTSQPPILRQR